MRLQKFGIKDSHYERPSHKWVCGRLAEGRPCAVGPDEQGFCNASVECFPLRDGDRWKCTRDQLRGGKCVDGPLPDGSCSSRVPQCLPNLSLRHKRGLVSRWVVVLSLATILILLSGSNRLNWLSPGELSIQHGTFNTRCEKCHSASHEEPTTWIIGTAFYPHDKSKESALCMKCHDFGDHALNPHSQNPPALTGIRDRLTNLNDPEFKAAKLSLINFVSAKPADSLSCAGCHTEHQGRERNLGMINDRQCQSCHSLRFDAFSKGHPDISGFSFQRRPRIIFDHQTHEGKYYPDEKQYPGEKQDFLCANCHHEEFKGNKMLSPGFDTGCRTCHINQIEGREVADAIGIAVISLPGLDIETLKERNIPIGEWPRYAESKITPFMACLLSTDPEFKEVQTKLDGIKDLLDLRQASDEDLHAVKALAWSVKRLLHELITGGHGALVSRLEQFFGTALKHDSMSDIVGGLSAGTLNDAQRKWFPNLADEMTRIESHDFPPAQFANEQEENPDSDKAPESEPPAATSDDDGGDFDLSAVEVEEEEFDLGNLSVSEDDFDLSNIEVDESATEEDSEPREQTEMEADEWAKLGGWYNRDFKLMYRPKSHADGFVKLWLETVALAAKGASTSELGLFKELTDPKAPGRCMKCHSIEKAADQAIRINWYGMKPDPDAHAFTTFAHRPHYSLIGNKGCITCHAWNEKAAEEFTAAYENYDSLSYSSNFAALSIKTCTECHAEGKASESCLTCHNYHVGRFPDLMHSIKTQ